MFAKSLFNYHYWVLWKPLKLLIPKLLVPCTPTSYPKKTTEVMVNMALDGTIDAQFIGGNTRSPSNMISISMAANADTIAFAYDTVGTELSTGCTVQHDRT
jgi:hypothetical protein